MAQHTFDYRGYTATVEWSDEDNGFVGQVEGLDEHTSIRIFAGAFPEAFEVFKELLDWYLDDDGKDGAKQGAPTMIQRESLVKISKGQEVLFCRRPDTDDEPTPPSTIRGIRDFLTRVGVTPETARASKKSKKKRQKK